VLARIRKSLFAISAMIDVRAIVSTLIARIRRRPFPHVLEKPTAQEAPGSTIAPYPLASGTPGNRCKTRPAARRRIATVPSNPPDRSSLPNQL
jgi:hypothetical protein